MTMRAATIRDLSRDAPAAGAVETVEVCVVGSGCGGATTARVLAEAGRDVLVLEEGADYTGAQLTQRDRAMYDQLYMDRGGRTTEDLAISVLQGRVLGGGGVINASDVVPIPDPVLRHWVKRWGLTDFTPEAIAPYRERALADLSARVIPDGEVNRANRLLRAGTEKLGWRGEVFHDNRKGCVGLGTCLIGCPMNAKRNPRFVAIPAALAAGARFFTRARAVRVADALQEVKTITVRTLDERGYHERGEFTVRAKVVVLAANAIGSAQLLLRSGLGNAHVGQHLSLQPQLPVTAMFDQEIQAYFGIPQAYAITEFETCTDDAGLGGFRVEAVMGTPGIVASILPLSGVAGKAQMALYPKVAASLCLVPDRNTGSVALTGSGRPLIRFTQTDDLHARFRAAAKAAARAYLAAGARGALIPTTPPVIVQSEADLARIDALGFPPASAPLLSAHQQGTVRFAASEKDGGADPEGRVYGTRDVYVFDSSGFPTTSSSHTMTPILTIAHYLAARLAARLRR